MNEYKIICRRNSLIHGIRDSHRDSHCSKLHSLPREPGPSGLRNTNPKEREEEESQSGESPGYSGGGLRAPPIYSKNPWKVARFTRCENRLTHPLPVLRMPVFARTFFSAHTSAHNSVSGRLTPPPSSPATGLGIPFVVSLP